MNARWVSNDEIKNGKIETGETVELNYGDFAQLIRPTNKARTEWVAQIIEPDFLNDFDIVEYLNE